MAAKQVKFLKKALEDKFSLEVLQDFYFLFFLKNHSNSNFAMPCELKVLKIFFDEKIISSDLRVVPWESKHETLLRSSFAKCSC